LRFNINFREVREMPIVATIIPMIILGFIFILGLLNAINPRITWKVFESWKATKEPSNAFFLFRRVIGVIAMLMVIGLVLFPYIMSRQ
jgi:hypothetical protein